jgi:hypothetical protein
LWGRNPGRRSFLTCPGLVCVTLSGFLGRGRWRRFGVNGRVSRGKKSICVHCLVGFGSPGQPSWMRGHDPGGPGDNQAQIWGKCRSPLRSVGALQNGVGACGAGLPRLGVKQSSKGSRNCLSGLRFANRPFCCLRPMFLIYGSHTLRWFARGFGFGVWHHDHI